MDALTTALYDVMYFYELSFTPTGIEANLAKWREAKAPLLELLRRHPNWNEQELSIVFDFSEGRGIDHNCVDESKFELTLLAQEVGLTPEDMEDFTAALDAATADYAVVPDPSRLPVIQQRGRIKCAEGQKASRIINRLCSKFNLDKYEVDKLMGEHGDNPTIRRVKPYNAVFARLADSLNPVEISKTGILSIHPCDFLEMSSKRNAWHSCHCLADGGYRGGCQSYMGDGVSMIFYTVDEDIKSDFRLAPRLTRQVFCYKDGLLLQSRLYPDNNDDTRTLYRSVVQRAISLCERTPNLWKTKRDRKEFADILVTAKGSMHYPDYEYSNYAVMSYLHGMPCDGVLEIGSPSLCLCCGQPYDYHNMTKCNECENVVVCKDCGKVIAKPSAIQHEGAYYCGDCVPRCDHCHTIAWRSILRTAVCADGRTVHLCADCYEAAARSCEQCSASTICTIIGGNKFCPHSQYSLAA